MGISGGPIGVDCDQDRVGVDTEAAMDYWPDKQGKLPYYRFSPSKQFFNELHCVFSHILVLSSSCIFAPSPIRVIFMCIRANTS
jgi:hypothetical protein